MGVYGVNDSKYKGLSDEEKRRQVDRDNMLYEQTEALKKLNSNNSNTNYSYSSDYDINLEASNPWLWWTCVLVFGGVAVAIYSVVGKDYCAFLGNIPYYIYAGLLILIPIIAMIKNIIVKISNNKKAKHIEEITPDIEKQIRKLQRKWDTIDTKSKAEESRLEYLKIELDTAIMYKDKEKEREVEKEMESTRDKIEEYTEQQIELEDEIKKLENEIY